MEFVRKDRYGRLVSVVYSDERCIQAEELRAGHAWVYARYCNQIECRGWQRLEKKARQEKVGLWAEDKPVPPWKWRRNK